MDSLANFCQMLEFFEAEVKTVVKKGRRTGVCFISRISAVVSSHSRFRMSFSFFGKSSLAIWYLLSANHR